MSRRLWRSHFPKSTLMANLVTKLNQISISLCFTVNLTSCMYVQWLFQNEIYLLSVKHNTLFFTVWQTSRLYSLLMTEWNQMSTCRCFTVWFFQKYSWYLLSVECSIIFFIVWKMSHVLQISEFFERKRQKLYINWRWCLVQVQLQQLKMLLCSGTIAVQVLCIKTTSVLEWSSSQCLLTGTNYICLERQLWRKWTSSWNSHVLCVNG